MFQNILPNNIQIYATTASNAEESSYACYYDEKRHAYLGDLYSVNFLENTETVDLKGESLEQQFKIVQNKTNLSHVQQYGEQDWVQTTIDKFFAYKNATTNSNHATGWKFNPSEDAVSSRDVKFFTLLNRLKNARDDIEKEIINMELYVEVSARQKADNTFTILNSKVGNHLLTNKKLVMDFKFNWDCYRNAINIVEYECGEFTDYSLKYAKNLAVMCASGISLHEIANAARSACN